MIVIIGTVLHTLPVEHILFQLPMLGCDSTATLNLTINNTPNVNIVASNTSLCFGDASTISATIGLDSL